MRGASGALKLELDCVILENQKQSVNKIYLCSTEYADQLQVPITIECLKRLITVAMIDSGASGNFINSEYIKKHKILTKKKKTARQVQVIDRRPIANRRINKECTFQIIMNDHIEEITCNVAPLG
jgi:hypothetical protein